MTANDLIAASVNYLTAFGPFVLVFLVIACAGELIGLVKWAAGLYRQQMFRRSDW